MAPRGRRPKVGQRRIDAALAAMSPLGFSEDVVRKSVKDLLKVYGGDDGWAFIEEAAYKLLVDTILEVQEEFHHDHIHEQQQQQEETIQQSHEDVECVPEIREKEVSEEQGVHEVSEQEGFDKELCEQEKIPEENFEVENFSSMKDGIPQAKLGVRVHYAPTIRSVPSADYQTTWKRKPCHGWISDDDDDDDLVISAPADRMNPY